MAGSLIAVSVAQRAEIGPVGGGVTIADLDQITSAGARHPVMGRNLLDLRPAGEQ